MDEFVENDVMHEDMQGIHERFMQVADKYEFDEQWIKDFDKAMFSDLLVYEHTISSMLEYCKGSAEVVGCMVARMLGCPPEAEEHARALGRAYQIINFIRDYDDDIQRGYKYITDDHSIYLKMFNEELDKGMAGLKYIPEHLQGAIIASSIQYMEIADNCEATLL
jgi:phytoene/squalene synthetase